MKKNDCPTEFTHLEEIEHENFYGRCVKKGNKIDKIQIVSIDSTKSYGLMKGEKEKFLVDITEIDPDSIKPSTKETQNVLDFASLEKEDYEDYDLLMKALEHKRYGYGKNIELGKELPYEHAKQKKELGKIFKSEKDAIAFMDKKLSKIK